LLALAAKETLGSKAVAVTSISTSFSKSEIEYSKHMAREIGIELLTVFQDDLSSEGYVANQVNRCYFCRSNLASVIVPIAKERSIAVCVDGTHLDDMMSPRPGVKALRGANFRAPLAELGFHKDQIRGMARYKALSNADKPSESCLSSRIAFGHRIDEATLRRIEDAERYVKSTVDLKVLRVRAIGKRAILELDYNSIQKAKERFKEVEVMLKSLGFESVEIDPEGYRTGKMLELFVNDRAS
jgi:uncharacterized protein